LLSAAESEVAPAAPVAFLAAGLWLSPADAASHGFLLPQAPSI
jgi:hypothetical protein